MSNVWVVTVRTSIQGESNREDYLKKTVKVFDSFEKGRKYFRSVIKKYAFSKNSIFDGNGIIKKLNQHKNTIQSYSEDDELNQYLSEDALLNYKDHNEYFVDNVTKIENALSNAYSGKNVQLDFDEPFLGKLEPGEALLVHFHIPVKGLKEDRLFKANEIEQQWSEVRVTPA